jgi:hypothetical protein
MASWAILAEGGAVPTRQELLERLRSGFAAEPTRNDLIVAIIGLLALVVLILLAYEFFRRRAAAPPRPARNYLLEAMNVLELRGQERDDVLRLALRSGLTYPVAMLLSPANLAAALRAAVLPGQEEAFCRRVGDLSVKLFGRSLPDQEAAEVGGRRGG